MPPLRRHLLLGLALLLPAGGASAADSAPASRPRVFVLTDIENEPDDATSLVRLLVYANQFEIEGLAATTSRPPENPPGSAAHLTDRFSVC
jgi:predicted outer membrane protein